MLVFFVAFDVANHLWLLVAVVLLMLGAEIYQDPF